MGSAISASGIKSSSLIAGKHHEDIGQKLEDIVLQLRLRTPIPVQGNQTQNPEKAYNTVKKKQRLYTLPAVETAQRQQGHGKESDNGSGDSQKTGGTGQCQDSGNQDSDAQNPLAHSTGETGREVEGIFIGFHNGQTAVDHHTGGDSDKNPK